MTADSSTTKTEKITAARAQPLHLNCLVITAEFD